MEAMATLVDDLEDIASLRLARFEKADEAIRIATQALRNGVSPLAVISHVTEWWEKHHPYQDGQSGAADNATLIAIIATVRELAGMGS